MPMEVNVLQIYRKPHSIYRLTFFPVFVALFRNSRLGSPCSVLISRRVCFSTSPPVAGKFHSSSRFARCAACGPKASAPTPSARHAPCSSVVALP